MKKEQCRFCKFAEVNEYYLESSIYDSVDDYLVCTKQDNKRVEDDYCCDSFELDREIYNDSK